MVSPLSFGAKQFNLLIQMFKSRNKNLIILEGASPKGSPQKRKNGIGPDLQS